MKKKIKIYEDSYKDLPSRFSQKIHHDLNYILSKDIPGLTKIYLFGSCARNEVRSTSDVDLLIITKEKLQDRMLASEIRWTLDEPILGIHTDVVYQNETSESSPSVFQTVIDRDKKLILEVEDD